MNTERRVKRFCTVGLFFLFSSVIFILPGCDSRKNEVVKTVGIVLFGDSRLPQVDGFKDGLDKLGYKNGESIQYIILNAKNKRPELKILVKELLDQDVDLLVAAGGLEADTMKKMIADKNVPVVVLYINAIIERGLVKSRRSPGWNVTGVDNLNAELSGKRVEVMQELLPDMKRILILYYKKIAPSRIGVKRAQEMAAKKGLIIDARAVSSRDEIRNIMENLKPGEVDAMLTVPTAPIDNAMKEIILPNVNRLKLPLMTHSRPLAEKGALASYGAHFYDMGVQASRLADKVMNGVEPSKIPFETPKKFIYTMNKGVMEELGIELTEISRNQVNEYISTTK
jgi:putative ABC transport system substrate-binding protein